MTIRQVLIKNLEDLQAILKSIKRFEWWGEQMDLDMML